MLTKILITTLIISLTSQKFCTTLDQVEINLKKDLKGRKLENLIKEGKVIKKTEEFILQSFLLNENVVYGLATKFTNERIESIELLSNFNGGEKIQDNYTSLIGCVNEENELFIIFKNFGEQFSEENIREYFLDELNFKERLEIYKKNYEIISVMEKKNYIKENFNFFNNLLIPQKTGLVDLSVNLIFDFYKEKKSYKKNFFEITDSPEQKNLKITTKGTNTYQSLLGILILEFGGEENISNKYPKIYQILNNENYSKINLEELIKNISEVIDVYPRFKVEEPNLFLKSFYFLSSFFFDYEIEMIYNFKLLVKRVFTMEPENRLSAEKILEVLSVLENKLWDQELKTILL